VVCGAWARGIEVKGERTRGEGAGENLGRLLLFWEVNGKEWGY
jgi:hypothetical protein